PPLLGARLGTLLCSVRGSAALTRRGVLLRSVRGATLRGGRRVPGILRAVRDALSLRRVSGTVLRAVRGTALACGSRITGTALRAVRTRTCVRCAVLRSVLACGPGRRVRRAVRGSSLARRGRSRPVLALTGRGGARVSRGGLARVLCAGERGLRAHAGVAGRRRVSAWGCGAAGGLGCAGTCRAVRARMRHGVTRGRRRPGSPRVTCPRLARGAGVGGTRVTGRRLGRSAGAGRVRVGWAWLARSAGACRVRVGRARLAGGTGVGRDGVAGIGVGRGEGAGGGDLMRSRGRAARGRL